MTPWVRRLLALNVAAFFLTMFYPVVIPDLLLVPALVPARPWTLITYMFLHGGLWHLAANMIGLFFFGPRLEARLGSARFLALYFVAGLAAAGASWIFTPEARIVGASGAIFGILYGFARYWPREKIFIWGVMPIEARWLVAGVAVLALFGGFGGAADGIAHFAHLGGFAGGFLYLWVADRGSFSGRSLKQRVGAMTGRNRPRKRDLERWARIDGDHLHEVNRSHLERIRRKMDEEGAGSLTRREREFLDRLSERQGG